MNIIELKLSEIKEYDKNPRKNDGAVDYVAESIKQFGFKVPIVVDKDNVIIAGHTRYKASKKLGLETVPCIKADDLTEEQVKAYRIADNKVSEFAMWDFELLDEELSEILDIDMESLGFVEEDFNHIEDLMTDDFISRANDPVIFSMTLVFPIEVKEQMDKFISEKGKDELVNALIKLVGEE